MNATRAVMLQAVSRITIGLALIICAVAREANAHDHAIPVPPTLEITVLDPRADPLGRPTVELRHDPDGKLQVDIPRSVLVHTLYYSGNRSFQAQLLPGGPSTVVVAHPRTGERCYIDLQLPPGAPKVIYTASCIEYDYGHQGVSIVFGRFCKPKVVYRDGVPIPRQVGKVTRFVAAETVHIAKTTGITDGVVVVAKGTTAAAINTAGIACGVTKQVATPVVAIAKSTPIGSLFKRDPAREAECQRERAAKAAEHREGRLNETIRTVR